MSKVVTNMSMSLDGFVAGPNVSKDLPMGEGGLRLHDWLIGTAPSDVDAEVARTIHATTGAVVLGRRIYDTGVGVWEDTPYPVPSFVLTHRAQQPRAMKSGSFTFVTDGIERALRQAKAAAGDKNVMLMGANTVQQFLRVGLLDELQLQIVPVLLGDGLRLFDHLAGTPAVFDNPTVIPGVGVTHLRYPVRKA